MLAGQNLGAGQPGRAQRTGWLAAGLFSVAMLVAAIVVSLQAESIIGVFNPDPELMELGGGFLRIEIVSFCVIGLVMVLTHCLNGVGATLVPMMTTLLSMWLVQVPLAWFLSTQTGLEVYGVRVGIVSAVALRAVICGIYF